MKSASSRGRGNSYPVYYFSVYQTSAGPVILTNIPRSSAEEDYAYGASEELPPGAVLMNVRVPANAELWFDDEKTSQTGRLRPFVTPALEPGKDYSYEIRARWTEGGRAVEQTRIINLRAGDRLTLNLTNRAD
jgi:uncharacterized protein (TIGR03000 family)